MEVGRSKSMWIGWIGELCSLGRKISLSRNAIGDAEFGRSKRIV